LVSSRVFSYANTVREHSELHDPIEANGSIFLASVKQQALVGDVQHSSIQLRHHILLDAVVRDASHSPTHVANELH